MSDTEQNEVEVQEQQDDAVSEASHDTNEDINDQLSGRKPIIRKKAKPRYREREEEDDVDEENSREDLLNRLKAYQDDEELGPIVRRNKKVIKDEKILETMSLEDLERQRGYCRRSVANASAPKVIRTGLHSMMPAIEQWACTHPVVRQKVKVQGISDTIVGNPKKSIKPDRAVDLTIRELDIEMMGGMAVSPWVRLPMALGAAVHAVHSRNLAFELLCNYVHQYGNLPEGYVIPPEFKTSEAYLQFVQALLARSQHAATAVIPPVVGQEPAVPKEEPITLANIKKMVKDPVLADKMYRLHQMEEAVISAERRGPSGLQKPPPRVTVPTLNTVAPVKQEEKKEEKEEEKAAPLPIANWRLRALGLDSQIEAKNNQ